MDKSEPEGRGWPGHVMSYTWRPEKRCQGVLRNEMWVRSAERWRQRGKKKCKLNLFCHQGNAQPQPRQSS